MTYYHRGLSITLPHRLGFARGNAATSVVFTNIIMIEQLVQYVLMVWICVYSNISLCQLVDANTLNPAYKKLDLFCIAEAVA